MCQGMDVDEWIDLQQENVLDTTYFHTVFTLPEEIYPLIYSNQTLLIMQSIMQQIRLFQSFPVIRNILEQRLVTSVYFIPGDPE